MADNVRCTSSGCKLWLSCEVYNRKGPDLEAVAYPHGEGSKGCEHFILRAALVGFKSGGGFKVDVNKQGRPTDTDPTNVIRAGRYKGGARHYNKKG